MTRADATSADTQRVNYEYYLKHSPGRLDYWRMMAAPRFRVATFLKILEELEPASLVDLGCGSGELLCEIRDRCPRIKLCGIDLSPTQIGANRKRDPSIDWRTIDMDRKLDFSNLPAYSFDVVMASEIIEHVEHPETFLANARKLARPNSGRLILSTQSGKVWETERCVGHRRHFRREEMFDLLTNTGWEVVRVWNAGFPFHNLAKLCANVRPEKTMRNYSEKPYNVFQRMICMGLRFAYKFNSSSRGAQLFAIARNR